MPQVTRRPEDRAIDLSDLTPEQRSEAVGAAAGMIADAAYENVVLSAWDALHSGRHDPFIRELMRRPNWQQVIRGPHDHQVVLEAMLTAAARDKPDAKLTHEAVAERLWHDEQRRRDMDEDYEGLRGFDGYVDALISRREGPPPADMAYWLQVHTRADALETAVRSGAHVDVEVPAELRQGPGRHALAVQRSQVALTREHDNRQAADIQLRDGLQGLGFTWSTAGVFSAASAAVAPLNVGASGALGAPALIFLVGSIGKSIQALRGGVRRAVADRRVGKLEAELDTHRETFHSAFGPMLPPRPSGPRR